MPPLARRIALLAVTGGVLFDIVIPGNAAGINWPLVIGAILGAALVAAGRAGLARMDPADAWLGPAALILAAMSALRADDWLVTVDLLLAAMLTAGAIGSLAGGRVTRGAVPRVLELAVGAVAASSVGAAVVLEPLLRQRGDRPAGAGSPSRLRRGLARMAPVLRGLAIAVPVAAVFAILFASADAVFARLASDVLAWQPDIDLGDLVGRAVIVTLVAWGSAGLLGLGAGLLPAFTPAGPALPAPPPAWGAAGVAWPGTTVPDRKPLRLGPVEAATIALAIDALFAAFVVLQLAWLFGGRDTLALTGYTYAEYARRGFFDLVIVAVLAGLLVVALDVAVARRTRLLLAASIGLLGLAAVVLVSAFLRLRLYQDAYGWTELRFVVLVAILWLGVAIVTTGALLAVARTRWLLHGLGILTLAAVAVMNVVGPQAFVTGQNLARAIDPSLIAPGGRTGLDAGYLAELGDEAVLPILQVWDRLGERERAELAPVLEQRRARLATDPALTGWPAWNLTRARAYEALRGWGPARRREAALGTASR